MRILDLDNDRSIKNITIYLTKEEAKEMSDDLQNLLNNKEKDFHLHIDDLEYEHEIILTLYDNKDLKGLNERSKKIILDDK